ncbi:MAG: hypothetical protein ACXV3F_08215, partial [Frankiaceae bacterium]
PVRMSRRAHSATDKEAGPTAVGPPAALLSSPAGSTNSMTAVTNGLVPNRVIKRLKRVGCHHRNQGNHERRSLPHIVAKNTA